MGCTASKEKEAQKGPDPRKQKMRVKKGPPALADGDNEVPLRSSPYVEPPPAVGGGDEGALKSEASKYKNGGPTVTGDTKALYEQGLAFKIVEGAGADQKWHFYNDDGGRELAVTYSFGPDSKLAAFGAGKLEGKDEEGWPKYTAVVYPGETSGFISGQPNGWKCSYTLRGLSEEYKEKQRVALMGKITEEIAAVEKVKAEAADATELKLMQKCVENGIAYVDLAFRPGDPKCISRPGVDEGRDGNMAWKRPTQYLSAAKLGDIAIFRGGIDPNDLDQGCLGDCWLIAAVAGVAEFPKLIQDLFVANTPDRNKAGAYVVRMNKHGWWQDVVVDDYFPCSGAAPAFCKTCEDPAELWASLLEKVYAKIHGSYMAIAGGFPLHAIIDYSGLPGWNLTDRWKEARAAPDSEASSKLFEDLCKWDDKHFLVCIGTPGVDESEYNVGRTEGTDKDMKKRYEDAGIVNGHAYTVLASKAFPKHGFKLCKIRNPWGNAKEWTGDWGDDDKKWADFPDVAKECGYTKEADGTFWMSWKDTLAFFDHGAVAGRGTWDMDCRAKGQFVAGVPSVSFRITNTSNKPQAVMLTLTQPDTRGRTKDDPDAKKQAMLLTVNVSPDGTQRYTSKAVAGDNPYQPTTKSTFKYNREQSMRYSLEPGEVALVVPKLYSKEDKNYVLSALTNGATDIKIETVAVDATCKLLEHYTSFSATEGIKSVKAELQVRNVATAALVLGSAPNFTKLIEKATTAKPTDLAELSDAVDEDAAAGGEPHTAAASADAAADAADDGDDDGASHYSEDLDDGH